MAATPLADLLDPTFLAWLTALPIEEIRTRRAQATEVEVGLSYVRRLVQGRLDIVLDEARRRDDGEQSSDLSALVERLPEILSEHVRGPGTGRLPTVLAPAEIDREHIDRLDRIVNAEQLATLPELQEADLRSKLEALAGLEEEVSAERRALHDVIDGLQEELVRRYKSGEATVDSLLT
ncbi:MAG TPA: hypothetical protein VLL25_07570 [Acidimicrobiales bacterium]|nr:hypothetical protein [Acidimicrobiales bacterium]